MLGGDSLLFYKKGIVCEFGEGRGEGRGSGRKILEREDRVRL